MKTAYRVEARGEACPTCHNGDQFDIIGPDECSQSQSWGDREEADYICELLNDAFMAGRASYAQQILDSIKVAEEPVVIEPPPPAPKSLDDDIPF